MSPSLSLLQTYALEYRNQFVPALDLINEIKECIDIEILTSVLNLKEIICAGEEERSKGVESNLYLTKKKIESTITDKINPAIDFIQRKLVFIGNLVRIGNNYRDGKISKDSFFIEYYDELNVVSQNIKKDIYQIYSIDTKTILSNFKEFLYTFKVESNVVYTIGKLDKLIENSLLLMSNADALKTNILSLIQILLDQQSNATLK